MGEAEAVALLMASSRGWRSQISLQRHRGLHRGCTGAVEAPQECWWDLGRVTELTHRALHYISKGRLEMEVKFHSFTFPPLPLSFTKRCMTQVHTCNLLED